MSGLLTLPAFEAQFPQTANGFQGSRSSTLQSLLVAICEPRTLRVTFHMQRLMTILRRVGLYDRSSFQSVCWWQTGEEKHNCIRRSNHDCWSCSTNCRCRLCHDVGRSSSHRCWKWSFDFNCSCLPIGMFTSQSTRTISPVRRVSHHLCKCINVVERPEIDFVQGVMTSYWINVGFFFTNGSISWRFPIAIQIIFAIIMIFCIVSSRFHPRTWMIG